MAASTKFYSLKMKEGEPIDQYVSSFRTARLKLEQAGTRLNEQDACIRFLSSLPPSYADFVTSQNAVLRMAKQLAIISSVDESEIPALDFNELVGALLQEEMSRQAAKGQPARSQALFTAK